MKIKQLKEKTIKGFIDFLPKVVVDNIEGLSDILNDKLSKSEGGEIKKPIVVTNNDSNYKTIINPDGSIYILNKNTNTNVFSLINTDRGVIINNNVYAPIRVNNIDALYDKHGNVLYNGTSNVFYANGFVINNGTDKQVLLGDGSTTSKLIKEIRITKSNDIYTMIAEDISNKIYLIELPGATKELAGLMTASDKAKLDDIENTYLPLSGGTLTGTLRLNDINSDQNGLDINNVNGIQSVDQDKVSTPEVWTTNASSIPLNKANGIPTLNENGKIDEDKIDNLRGYVSSQNENVYTDYDSNNGVVTLDISGDYDIEGSGGRIRLKYTEDGKSKMSIMIDGTESSVNAEKFNSIVNPNKNEVWCTDGSRLNILTLLSNAAIYVAGGFELAGAINNTTVIDNPDSIIFSRTGRFLAKKDSVYYTHWNADISKNIAPPSRYGIETNEGVFPFNNQMYKFSDDEYIHIAVCSNGTCSMKILTLE